MKNLVNQISTLETSVNTLREQLHKQQKENSDLINELNATQLYDEDFKCPICFEVFIRVKFIIFKIYIYIYCVYIK